MEGLRRGEKGPSMGGGGGVYRGMERTFPSAGEEITKRALERPFF